MQFIEENYFQIPSCKLADKHKSLFSVFMVKECEVLRSEAEAKHQASDALTKDQAEVPASGHVSLKAVAALAQELKQCKAAIDQMKCRGKEQADLVSSQEQDTKANILQVEK